jgi:cyclopropane fatty-acyl-phospholipid synthase-like methyltransferase
MPEMMPTDPFHEPYDREAIAYGAVPSGPLAAYLRQVECGGRALDLGAGAGRDSIALAKAGFQVTAVDLSERGAQRIRQRAEAAGVGGTVQAVVENVCDYEIAEDTFDAICATTVLDHIPRPQAEAVWRRMVAGLRQAGVMYVEVHSTEDPGSDQSPGHESDAPVSETADAVVNYFPPNQLARWALAEEARLRILRYEERLEWDYTHGPEHQHGKAILLAVKQGAHPPWYGDPAAFPKRER